VPCSPRTAIAGANNLFEIVSSAVAAQISGVDGRVLYNGGLRTGSGPDGSSPKLKLPCVEGSVAGVC